MPKLVHASRDRYSATYPHKKKAFFVYQMAGKTIYSDHKMSIIYPIQYITVQCASLQNRKNSYTNVTNSGNTCISFLVQSY